MPDLKVTAPAGSKLHEVLHGNGWTAEYARKCVPILVRWIEEENASHSAVLHEHTYKELAIALGDAKIARPIPHALGLLGNTLEELQKQHPGTFGGKIPPIELLVWRKGANRPGDAGFWWVGIKKSKLKDYSETALRSIAAQVRREIIAYPHWRKVLKILNLKPLTIDLPDTRKVLSDPGFCGRSGKESPEHWRLKHYVAGNYSRLGLKGKHIGTVEHALLSGDEVDVLLESASDSRLVGVEVKSRISSEADLIRGVFQGVKYRAVLGASEDYETSRTSTWLPRAVDVVLVTELPLPSSVAALAKRFGVPHIVLKVPADYVAPTRA
jgi:hypothetical protein